MNSIFGAKLKIIDGYPGTNEILLALERGEVDGLIGYSWGAAKTGSAAMIQSGKLINILQLGLKKHPELPNLPLITDLVKTADEKQFMELVFARQTMGRPLMAPEGTPSAIVLALREGFVKAMNDPELIETAKKIGLEVDSTTGAEVQALVDGLHRLPDPVIERAQKLLAKK
jgi:tripartite-type tricarboxylate transporter receptor subunit TctC